MWSLRLVLVALCAAAAVAIDVHQEGEDWRLIALVDPKEKPPMWMTRRTVHDTLLRKGIKFMDITAHVDEDRQQWPRVQRQVAFPAQPSHPDEVRAYIAAVDMDEALDHLTTFSSFFTRYYLSTTGVESADWLYSMVLEYVRSASGANVSVAQWTHSGHSQRSLIASFPGQDPSLPVVVIGAHEDSINGADPMEGRSPGADDNGSGSITILEAFRVLLMGGFNPVHPVEFQWYAAEEVGLLGSQDIAASYRSENKQIYGMLNMDMTGYTTLPQQPIRVVDDYVDASLNDFTVQLIDEYTNLEWRMFTCGYACSDHASFNRSGYSSVFIHEAGPHPTGHSADDDMSLIVWSQVEQFIHLTIAFAVELGHGVGFS